MSWGIVVVWGGAGGRGRWLRGGEGEGEWGLVAIGMRGVCVLGVVVLLAFRSCPICSC